MEKNYRKIQFRGGQTIESAMLYLERFKQHGELAYGEFNGHKLYSDIDDLDSAYKKITGRTKAEFDSERKREHLEYEEEQRKHKEAIPELTKEWIEKGNAILDEKYHRRWAEIVPIRLSDLYQGMELKCSINVLRLCDLKFERWTKLFF